MSLTIFDLEFYLVEIPCLGQEPPVRSLLVRLGTNRGLDGWGEAALPWQAAELPGRRAALLPVLAGRSVFDVEDLLRLAGLRASPLCCAVEMACWDVIGRAAAQPLCHLFGGVYRPRVPLTVRLSGQDPAEVARLSRELSQQGFHAQIVPGSGNLRRDVETLHAVRDSATDRTQLRFDAGGCYDMEAARELCGELETAQLEAVLDPLGTRNLDPLASLRRQTSVPLAVWRAIRSPADLLAVVRCGAAGSAVIDLSLVGGLVPARKCAAVAQAAALGTALRADASVGVAAAALLQLACATPVFSGSHECAYHQLQDDVLGEPLEIVDGMVAVPLGPGLGVEVDRAKVERRQIA